MCGGGGGGDGGAGAREAERQEKIKKGYDEIKRIFEGYTTGINKVAAPAIGSNYYSADGTPVSMKRIKVANPNRPTSYPKGSEEYYGRGEPLYIDQDVIMAGDKNLGLAGSMDLFSGTQNVGGFDDAFYATREKAYTDFARPQLDEQYDDAQEQLIYALARGGRLGSSTRGEKFGDLQQKYNIQKTNVADKAREYSGTVRSNIERSRADLTALNASLADPTAVANQARLAAESLKTQQAFDPLAPLFQNVTEGLATQADLERRNAARYSTGLFNTGLSNGAGRTIRG
jgi:hypothetical protein